MNEPKAYIKKEEVTLTHPDLSTVWLDSSDVLRLIHCSMRTLNKLRAKGLPFYKTHMHYCLYKYDEVMAFIESGKNKEDSNEK